jgi:hypothetical protein
MNVSDYTAAVRALILGLVLTVASEQGAGPVAEGFQARARAGELVVAANFHYRGFSRGGRSYFLDKHLVVEVGLFGPKGGHTGVTASQFSLRINGRQMIAPVPAGLVAYSMKWQGVDRGVTAQAGPVILGGPGAEPRFPGDRPQVPMPRVPPPSRPGGGEAAPEETLGEILAAGALPEGDVSLPVTGYLYFPYSKKTKSLKSVELVYFSAGPLALRLK